MLRVMMTSDCPAATTAVIATPMGHPVEEAAGQVVVDERS